MTQRDDMTREEMHTEVVPLLKALEQYIILTLLSAKDSSAEDYHAFDLGVARTNLINQFYNISGK